MLRLGFRPPSAAEGIDHLHVLHSRILVVCTIESIPDVARSPSSVLHILEPLDDLVAQLGALDGNLRVRPLDRQIGNPGFALLFDFLELILDFSTEVAVLRVD